MKYFLILIPALIHIYIFVLESLLWGKARTNKAFHLTNEEAKTIKGFAFNQGFYNLFLALAIISGFIFTLFGQPLLGMTLEIYGLGSIIGAGLVLLASAPSLFRSAFIQIIPAALGLGAVFLL